jgi:hypothetical protein
MSAPALTSEQQRKLLEVAMRIKLMRAGEDPERALLGEAPRRPELVGTRA